MILFSVYRLWFDLFSNKSRVFLADKQTFYRVSQWKKWRNFLPISYQHKCSYDTCVGLRRWVHFLPFFPLIRKLHKTNDFALELTTMFNLIVTKQKSLSEVNSDSRSRRETRQKTSQKGIQVLLRCSNWKYESKQKMKKSQAKKKLVLESRLKSEWHHFYFC